MKTIFLWVNYYIEHPDIGTTVKIKSEINALRSMGYQVAYTAYLDNGVAVYDFHDKQIAFKPLDLNNGIKYKFKKRDTLIQMAREHIASNTYDYCLLRINQITHAYLKMLREMHEKSFVMMESLSYFPEMKFKDINVKDANVLGYFLLLYSLKRHKNSFKKYIDLMLTEGVMKDFYGVPCVEFGMGVDVDNFKEHEYCGKKDEINLLMVGCSSVYHGTDRIINSMIDYYQNEENKCVIKLHLVGSALEKHKELAQNKLVKDKIIFYGQQFGDGLEKIYDMCNVALGPLSQHRLKKRDTGLKTKEYLAKGIPYVYSGEEIQLEDNYPYIMKVPDTEDLLDLNTIIDFYNGIKDDTDMVMNMRKKARDVFSWISIFEKTFYVANKVKGGIEKCY